MKERILTGWNAQRWLRLGFGIVFLIAGITEREPVALVAAAFFGVQALFDVGCCGNQACVPPAAKATGRIAVPDVVTNKESDRT